jgi:hypothetical protein
MGVLHPANVVLSPARDEHNGKGAPQHRVVFEPKVRPAIYLQTTLPKTSLTMNEGIQKPVLTFTNAAPTRLQPTI